MELSSPPNFGGKLPAPRPKTDGTGVSGGGQKSMFLPGSGGNGAGTRAARCLEALVLCHFTSASTRSPATTSSPMPGAETRRKTTGRRGRCRRGGGVDEGRSPAWLLLIGYISWVYLAYRVYLHLPGFCLGSD